jgi:hypothetical protein
MSYLQALDVAVGQVQLALDLGQLQLLVVNGPICHLHVVLVVRANLRQVGVLGRSLGLRKRQLLRQPSKEKIK